MTITLSLTYFLKKKNDMQSLKEQIKEIHNGIAESQWKIMCGKSIEETIKEIINKCLDDRR